MSVAHFVHFKRTERGGSSWPVDWRGRRNLQCSSARRQTANQRSYLQVIGPRKYNISTTEAKKKVIFEITTKIVKIYRKMTYSDIVLSDKECHKSESLGLPETPLTQLI